MELLTRKDLAKRWQVSERSIIEWEKKGILAPAKGLPVIRFTPDYIAELEGVDLKATSPLQVRRLEREIESLKKTNSELNAIISKVFAETAMAIRIK